MINRTTQIACRIKTADFNTLDKIARAKGQTPAVWVRDLVNAELKRIIANESRSSERGAGRSASVSPGTGIRVPHSSSSPALVRSWSNLETEERLRLGKEWAPVVPLPVGFKDMDGAAKVAWLDRNWPLNGKPPESVLETPAVEEGW